MRIVQEVIACLQSSEPTIAQNVRKTHTISMQTRTLVTIGDECACIEIETTRDIAHQIVRHRSFSFQEFSQRYAEPSAMGDAFTKESVDYKI